MRNTKQKKLVFEIIENSYEHLTANEIYELAKKEISNISLGTVYRILNELVDNNQILSIKSNNDITHYDHLTNPSHYHFICDNCNKIFDINNITYKIPNDQLLKYQVNDIKIILTGLCNDCKEGRN